MGSKRVAWYQGFAVTRKGGPGSGNHGHAGRSGQRGGSAPRQRYAGKALTGVPYYRVTAKESIPKEILDEKKRAILAVKKDGTVWAAATPNERRPTQHAEMLYPEGVHGKAFDELVRVDYEGQELLFSSYTAGVGHSGDSDFKAEKNLKWAARRLIKGGFSPQTKTTWELTNKKGKARRLDLRLGDLT